MNVKNTLDKEKLDLEIDGVFEEILKFIDFNTIITVRMIVLFKEK